METIDCATQAKINLCAEPGQIGYHAKMKFLLFRSAENYRLNIKINEHNLPHQVVDAVIFLLNEKVKGLDMFPVAMVNKTVIQKHCNKSNDLQIFNLIKKIY